MQPVESKSLKERVLDRLRSAITSSELKPGQPLIAAELASQLGVSSATLREVIQVLSVEGFVETIPYHVPTVKKVSRKDIEDLFGVRSMLEAFATRQIIVLGQSKSAAHDLYKVCEDMMQAAENDKLLDVNWNDRKFHETLMRHSNNGLLNTFWQNVAHRVQQMMSLRNEKKGDLLQIVKNHLAIVVAIENEAVEDAVQLIIEHIGSVGDEIAETWDEE
ncbi:MAG: GntR family transcriptional regulator [Phototrophicaceae bacterium]